MSTLIYIFDLHYFYYLNLSDFGNEYKFTLFYKVLED